MHLTRELSSIIRRVNLWLSKRIENSGRYYMSFGVFGLFNYPISYFIWHNITFDKNQFFLRVIAAMLCIPLVLHNSWPKNLKTYLPLYWYGAVLFIIPFFETYTLLVSQNKWWSVNIVLALFIFTAITDYLMFTVLLITGIVLAYVTYLINYGLSHGIMLDNETIEVACYMYISTIVITLIFSRNKEKENFLRLQSMKALAMSLAHEIRTPLASIQVGVKGIEDFFVKKSSKEIPEQFNDVLQLINSEVKSANNIMSMILTNLSDTEIEKNEFKICSASECVLHAVSRYPLSEINKQLIHIDTQNNFFFKGSNILLVHILFNLIKNAIYHIKQARKGQIYIYFINNEKYNKLCFKDTGQGMNRKMINRVFDHFYTRTHYGNGIGLAFCKHSIEMMDGRITCESEENEYTIFSLVLPRITELRDMEVANVV